MEIPIGFIEDEAHSFHIITRPVYHETALSMVQRDPEKVLGGSNPGVQGSSGPMRGRGPHVEIPLENGETLIFKKQRRGGLYGRLRGDIFRNEWRAVSEVALSETAWKKGVPVAQVAFALSAPAGEGYLAGYRRAYLATIKLPGARNLMEWLATSTDRSERRAVIKAAAQCIERAHDRGFMHADLNLGNVLVQKSALGEYSAWLVDLSRSHLGGTMRFRQRLDNLMRLYRSSEKWMPADDPRARLREMAWFLRDYTRGDRAQARQYFQAASRYRASLLLHRMTWKEDRLRSSSTSRAGR